MTALLNESVAKRISKLMRMLGSSFEGEAQNALRKMQGLLEAEGLTFTDIADMVENHQGEIEERKWSDADAKAIFERGVNKGRGERREDELEFYDADGQPRWYEMAVFCQRNTDRLRGTWEKEFVGDIAGKVLDREPSRKQAQCILRIFVKLGGRCDPKVKAAYF